MGADSVEFPSDPSAESSQVPLLVACPSSRGILFEEQLRWDPPERPRVDVHQPTHPSVQELTSFRSYLRSSLYPFPSVPLGQSSCCLRLYRPDVSGTTEIAIYFSDMSAEPFCSGYYASYSAMDSIRVGSIRHLTESPMAMLARGCLTELPSKLRRELWLERLVFGCEKKSRRW